MSSPVGTRKRTRQSVTPSIVKSETFLFALLVLSLAIYVPYVFRTSKAVGGDGVVYSNTTTPIINFPDPFSPASPPVVVQGATQAPLTAASSQSTEPQRPAPITYILPYLIAFAQGLLNLVSKLPLLIYRLLHAAVWKPLGYPLALILAVLRPVTLLLEIIYEVFLRTPLSILSWFVREAIFPL